MKLPNLSGLLTLAIVFAVGMMFAQTDDDRSYSDSNFRFVSLLNEPTIESKVKLFPFESNAIEPTSDFESPIDNKLIPKIAPDEKPTASDVGSFTKPEVSSSVVVTPSYPTTSNGSSGGSTGSYRVNAYQPASYGSAGTSYGSTRSSYGSTGSAARSTVVYPSQPVVYQPYASQPTPTANRQTLRPFQRRQATSASTCRRLANGTYICD